MANINEKELTFINDTLIDMIGSSIKDVVNKIKSEYKSLINKNIKTITQRGYIPFDVDYDDTCIESIDLKTPDSSNSNTLVVAMDIVFKSKEAREKVINTINWTYDGKPGFYKHMSNGKWFYAQVSDCEILISKNSFVDTDSLQFKLWWINSILDNTVNNAIYNIGSHYPDNAEVINLCRDDYKNVESSTKYADISIGTKAINNIRLKFTKSNPKDSTLNLKVEEFIIRPQSSSDLNKVFNSCKKTDDGFDIVSPDLTGTRTIYITKPDEYSFGLTLTKPTPKDDNKDDGGDESGNNNGENQGGDSGNTGNGDDKGNQGGDGNDGGNSGSTGGDNNGENQVGDSGNTGDNGDSGNDNENSEDNSNKDDDDDDEGSNGGGGDEDNPAGKPEVPITKPIRKAIKQMAYIAQIARLIELMPTPQDFATRIAGDIIYLSSLVQKFVTDINKVLEGYSNIPWDYLNSQLNSIQSSLNNNLNRVQEYTNYVVDNTLGLATDVMAIGNEMYETTMDIASHTAQTVSSFGSAIASTSSAILGDTDTALKIIDSVENWTPENGINPIKQGMAAVVEAQNKANGFINDTIGDAFEGVNKATQFVQGLIDKLRGWVEKLTEDINGAFGNIISRDTISSTMGTLAEFNGDYTKALASQVVGASSQAIQTIVDNFDLGKFVSAFIGVATNAVLISTGLNELPPINLDLMLKEFQGKLNKDPLDGLGNDITFDDLIEYDPETYNNLKQTFETHLKQQREEMLNKKKNIFNIRTADAKVQINASKKTYQGMSKEERQNMKSLVNEIRKKRKAAKGARVSKKLKDVLLEQLKKIGDECKKFAKRLKEEWEAMLKTYKDAVKQIKNFFSNLGGGDRYVSDLCLDINENCDNIVQLCTVDMPTEIAGSATKAVLPYCFGMAIPNFAHNVVSFIVDVKVILKFIMDLIKYIMNILDDIKKIAQLFLTALKKLRDIFNQLMDLLGLGWLMDLVKDIIELFQSKVDEACEMLEGSLTAVYLRDFPLYEDMIGEIERFIAYLEGKEELTDIGENDGIEMSTPEPDSSDEPVITSESWGDFTDWPKKIKKDKDGNPQYDENNNPIYEDDEKISQFDIAIQKNLDKWGHINGLLVLMGVEPINIEEGNSMNGYTYRNCKYRSFPLMSGIFSRPYGFYQLLKGYNKEKVIKALKNKIKEIRSIDATYIIAYRGPHFSRKGVNYKKGEFDVSTGIDPSVIDSWIYYHSNLDFFGYDIQSMNINGNKFNYEDLPLDSEFKLQYSTFMENASHAPATGWQKEVLMKPYPIGNWSNLNIDGNTTITAYEMFYWFRQEVNSDNFYDMVNPKFPNIDDYIDDDDYGDSDSDWKDDKFHCEFTTNVNVETQTGTYTSSEITLKTKSIVGEGNDSDIDYEHNDENTNWLKNSGEVFTYTKKFGDYTNKLSRSKTWDYISKFNEFDVIVKGNRTGQNRKEQKVVISWELDNAFTIERLYDKFEMINYDTNSKLKSNETLENGKRYMWIETGIKKNNKGTISGLLTEDDMINVLSLSECQVENIGEPVTLNVSIKFGVEKSNENSGDIGSSDSDFDSEPGISDSDNIGSWDDSDGWGDDSWDDEFDSDFDPGFNPDYNATVVTGGTSGSVVRILVNKTDNNGNVILGSDGKPEKEYKFAFVKNRIVENGDWIKVNGKYYKVSLPNLEED